MEIIDADDDLVTQAAVGDMAADPPAGARMSR